jgi:hypothetical protein
MQLGKREHAIHNMVGRERWQIRPHLLGIGGARDKVHERSVAPIYIAVDSGDANNEVALSAAERHRTGTLNDIES